MFKNEQISILKNEIRRIKEKIKKDAITANINDPILIRFPELKKHVKGYQVKCKQHKNPDIMCKRTRHISAEEFDDDKYINEAYLCLTHDKKLRSEVSQKTYNKNKEEYDKKRHIKRYLKQIQNGVYKRRDTDRYIKHKDYFNIAWDEFEELQSREKESNSTPSPPYSMSDPQPFYFPQDDSKP